MFRDEQDAPGWEAGTGATGVVHMGDWIAHVNAAAIMHVAERRRMVAASMVAFARLARQPQQRSEALRLLAQIIQLLEALYSAEESLLASGADRCARRLTHHAVLRDLRASVVRLTANDGTCDEFELVHAIDALLHDWIVSGRMGALQPVTIN